MSWSIYYASKAAFENDERGTGSSAAEQLSIAEQEQVAAARAAAKSVVDSASVGSGTKDFSINLAGHANPGHEPTPGWANDCVQVNVTQKPAS